MDTGEYAELVSCVQTRQEHEVSSIITGPYQIQVRAETWDGYEQKADMPLPFWSVCPLCVREGFHSLSRLMLIYGMLLIRKQL